MPGVGDDHPVMSRFPSELRRWRTVRRLSQLELAARAGTTQRHVSFIEQGRSRPGRSVVVRLAESMERLSTDERIHAPAPVHPDLHISVVQRREHFDRVVGSHPRPDSRSGAGHRRRHSATDPTPARCPRSPDAGHLLL
jgi:transcriptional regulator with XRE-family HTH domain